MYTESEKPKEQFKPVTSRQLAELIDALVTARIIEMGSKLRGNVELSGKMSEDAEVVIRMLADAFKSLDQNPGVAVFAKDE